MYADTYINNDQKLKKYKMPGNLKASDVVAYELKMLTIKKESIHHSLLNRQLSFSPFLEIWDVKSCIAT